MFQCPDCKKELPNGDLIECSCGLTVIPVIVKSPKIEKTPYQFKRTRIKPVSKKRQAANLKYAKSKPLNKEEKCARCQSFQNLTRHHPYGRSGEYKGKLTITLWVWLCLECHNWVHDNSTLALDMGWLQPKFYNRPETKTNKPWL